MSEELRAIGLSVDGLKLVAEGVLLDIEAATAFEKLVRRAARAGFGLSVASGFRGYDHQLQIVNDKWLGLREVTDAKGFKLEYGSVSDQIWLKAILRYSALPGTSRHHWGTDIDIWDQSIVGQGFTPKLIYSEYTGAGEFSEMTEWLDRLVAADDAEGFFKPYKEDRGGVAPEPWHISYRPVADKYQRLLSLENCMSLWKGKSDPLGHRHEPLAMLKVVEPLVKCIFDKYVFF